MQGVIEVVQPDNNEAASSMKMREVMLGFEEAGNNSDASDSIEERFLSSCRK